MLVTAGCPRPIALNPYYELGFLLLLLQSIPMLPDSFQDLLQIQGKILGFHHQSLDFFIENETALPPRGR